MPHVFNTKDWPYHKMAFCSMLNKVNKDKLKKVKVAFLDTGCDTSIYFFNGFPIKKNHINFINDGDDFDGHGTFFASVLAQYIHIDQEVIVNGEKNIYHYYPEVTSIKVGETGDISVKNIIEGLKLCLEEDIDVISIGACNTCFNNEMANLIYKLAEKNKLIFVPAGNNIINTNTYPSSLNTVMCGGMTNENNIISNISNNKNVDVFIPSTNIAGIMNCDLVKKYKLKFDEDGLLRLSGTSFSVAILTAFGTLIKSIYPNINIYQLKYLFSISHKKDADMFYDVINLLLNYNKSIPELRKENIYLKIINPINYLANEKWKVQLYNEKGEKCRKEFLLKVCIYNDIRNRNILKEKYICLTNGKAEFSFDNLKAGFYYIEVYNNEFQISSISMAFIKPAKPSIRMLYKDIYQVMITCDDMLADKIFYTYDNDIAAVLPTAEAIFPTKEYIMPFTVEKGHKQINAYSFYQGVFSNVETVQLENF